MATGRLPPGGEGPIIALVRRIHVSSLQVGRIVLAAAQAHHLRDVLRLSAGDGVELFDDAGSVGRGKIVESAKQVVVNVEELQSAAGLAKANPLLVVAAIPKGSRADWMIEKLSELGVDEFIPLATERGVTLPGGKSKSQRWRRLATEAARQCGRRGVMTIGETMELQAAMNRAPNKKSSSSWLLSPSPDATPIQEFLTGVRPAAIFVGPEGGWTQPELDVMKKGGLTSVRLTGTILRVETAAVLAAGIAALLSAGEIP